LLNITGDSVARVCIALEEWLPARVSQHVSIIRPDPSELDSHFLRYFLASPNQQAQMLGLASSGATRNALTKGMIEDFRVPCPNLNEQREIADFLSAFDEKIELNRRMNTTLEAMAQALFKSWFVDFDPVKAKAAGRAPEGMDADTAALFPSAFAESEQGPIPKGWQRGKLGELCFNHREGVKPGEVEPDTPYIGLEHMPRKCIALDDWAYASEAESGKSSFRTGDILFGKLRPYFHKAGVAPIDGVCSTDILVIRPIAHEFFGIALGHLSSVELINYADKHSNGAKMPRTKWEDLAAYQIVIPSKDVALSLSIVTLAAVEKIRGNIAESRTLAELRDALLPRLISGQLRIPEAEKMAEAAR
ncbi:MAG: restriction endonuclease subunit S, partial [Blastocatellia bacterium]